MVRFEVERSLLPFAGERFKRGSHIAALRSTFLFSFFSFISFCLFPFSFYLSNHPLLFFLMHSPGIKFGAIKKKSFGLEKM